MRVQFLTLFFRLISATDDAISCLLWWRWNRNRGRLFNGRCREIFYANLRCDQVRVRACRRQRCHLWCCHTFCHIHTRGLFTFLLWLRANNKETKFDGWNESFHHFNRTQIRWIRTFKISQKLIKLLNMENVNLNSLKSQPKYFSLNRRVNFQKRLIARNAEQQMILCNSVLEKATNVWLVRVCWCSSFCFVGRTWCFPGALKLKRNIFCDHWKVYFKN